MSPETRPDGPIGMSPDQVSPDRMTGSAARSARPLRIALVDDHALFRSGLKAMLELEEGWTVVAEAPDEVSAIEAIRQATPEVALIDLQLQSTRGAHGSLGGLDLISRLRHLEPSLRLVVLTTFLDAGLIFDALERGAHGYVVKAVEVLELVRVVRAVSAGEVALDLRSSALAAQAFARANERRPGYALSDREHEIACLVAEGLTNSEIAARAFCSTSTVKFHLGNIMQKLGVHHRSAVAAAAAGDPRVRRAGATTWPCG